MKLLLGKVPEGRRPDSV